MKVLRNEIITIAVLILLIIGTVGVRKHLAKEDLIDHSVKTVTLPETYPTPRVEDIVLELEEPTVAVEEEIIEEVIAEEKAIVTEVAIVKVSEYIPPPVVIVTPEVAEIVVAKEKIIEEVVVESTTVEEPVSTMSCPDEPSTNVAVGFKLNVGAYNDLEDGGTILYSLPSFGLEVFQVDGLGIGSSIYVATGLSFSNSTVIDGLLGLSYGYDFGNVVVSSTGGIYGSFMQYSRDNETNQITSLGLGANFKVLFPLNNGDNSWGVSLGINTGFVGDPNGSVTLGFVIH